MSLNNNKIETNLVIDNSKILFVLEQKEIKLDNIVINKINEYIDILKIENNNLRNEIIKQKDDNEKSIKELKNEIENIKKELNKKNKINEEINNILNDELKHNLIIKDIKNENNKIKEKMKDVEFQINNIRYNLSPQTQINNPNMMGVGQMGTINMMNMNMPMNNMGNMMGNGFVMSNNLYNSNLNNTNNRSSMNEVNLPSDYIRIKFNASTGNETTIVINKERSLKDLFKKYAEKIGLSEEVFGKEVIFLFNGGKLDTEEEQSIISFFRSTNNITITVFDQNNIIGTI